MLCVYWALTITNLVIWQKLHQYWGEPLSKGVHSPVCKTRMITDTASPLHWLDCWVRDTYKRASLAQRIHLQCRRCGFNPWVWKIRWRRKWQPTPVSLPGKSHGQKRLEGYSPPGRKESDTTERPTLAQEDLESFPRKVHPWHSCHCFSSRYTAKAIYI